MTAHQDYYAHMMTTPDGEKVVGRNRYPTREAAEAHNEWHNEIVMVRT